VTPASRAQGWRRLAVIVAAVLVADQVAKAFVVGSIESGERVEVLPFLDLVHVMNEGVAFGFLGEGDRAAVLAVTGAALVFVMVWFMRDPARPWSWLAIGLLAGGAIGNLADRLFRDAVVDFIDLPAWPSFNVADIAITAGAALLVLSAFRRDERGSAAAPAENSRAG
jgi:signal peptidase II